VATKLFPGLVIADRYQLDRELGRGGMGSVWAAEHLVTRRSVAMKFVMPGVGHHTEMRRRLLREARAATAARHPNVVEVYDIFDVEDEMPVMVMALLHGETLADHFARLGSLSLPELANLLVPVISAVGAAHAVGVIHRDLKPENVFLSHEGANTVVRVLDFGIAKLIETPNAPATSQITAAGYMLGTPRYMAPEQLFGDPDLDHRADIWSIGSILYEGLTGRRAIEGDHVGQVLKRFMTAGVTPISTISKRLPSEVCSLITRMLSTAREARPNDLREVFETLKAYSSVPAPDFEPPEPRAFTPTSEPAPTPAPTHIRRVGLSPGAGSEGPPTTRIARTVSDGSPRSALSWRCGKDALGELLEVDLTDGVTVRMRWMRPGTFQMGSPETELGRRNDEGPCQEVVLTKGFWLAETPCTQAEWRAVMDDDPSRFRADARPVERVSWEDCQVFCRRLSARAAKLWARLPTEAEWEYACRSGTNTAFHDGSACTVPERVDPALDRLGWYAGNSQGATAFVRQLASNAWGLHDVHGNVWEWCEDHYGPYPSGSRVDPSGPGDGHVRVIRGGSWVNLPRLCRSACRRSRHATNRADFLGFRLAAELTP
jgi:serine/threonine-protein kinase